MLGYGSMPVSVPDKVIEEIKQRMREREFVKRDTNFKEGEPVIIIEGPLVELVGIFKESCSSKERVKILLSILRRSVEVQLNRYQLDRATEY